MSNITEVNTKWTKEILRLEPKRHIKKGDQFRVNNNENLIVTTMPRHGKTVFGRRLLNDFYRDENNYRPYSINPVANTQHQGIPLRWSEDEIKAESILSFQRELENFPDTGNDDMNMYSAMALRAFGIDNDRTEKLKNGMIYHMILFKYRNALKIQARRKKVIAEYALRFTEFCKLNAESRRKQKRVSEQFKELIKWKLKKQ